MKEFEKKSANPGLQRRAFYLFIALIPAFSLSVFFLFFGMFQLKIVSHLEVLWHSFIFVCLGLLLMGFYDSAKGRLKPARVRKIFSYAAYLILSIQCYLGYIGILQSFTKPIIPSELIWLMECYGFALVGGLIWGCRDATKVIEGVN